MAEWFIGLQFSSLWFFFFTFAASYLIIRFMKRFKQGMNKEPPCLPSIPILGSLPFIPTDMLEMCSFFTRKAETVGPVFAFYVGSTYTVVLNGKQALTEALVRPEFSDRSPYCGEVLYSNVKNMGISMKHYNADYKRYHKLTLSILKELGFGSKDLMEERILLEVEIYVDTIQSMKGEAFNPECLTRAAASSIILNMLFGRRFLYEDQRLLDLNNIVIITTKDVSPIVNVIPWIRFIPYYNRSLQRFGKNCHILQTLVKEEINKSLSETPDECFVKIFAEKEGNDYDEDQLSYITRDLTVGGTDTTTVTLLWGMIMLANHPEIQKRIQSEIDSIVARDRFPSVNDQPNLPYLEASILELMRWRTIVPFAILHVTLNDTSVNGFHIPSGANVFPNLYSVHNDPNMWTEPGRYNPDRFLDSSGRVFGGERTMPFGVGKRSCIGEILARQEVFLFFAAIVQRFHVLPPDGTTTLNDAGQGDLPVKPHPFEIRMVPRW